MSLEPTRTITITENGETQRGPSQGYVGFNQAQITTTVPLTQTETINETIQTNGQITYRPTQGKW